MQTKLRRLLKKAKEMAFFFDVLQINYYLCDDYGQFIYRSHSGG